MHLNVSIMSYALLALSGVGLFLYPQHYLLYYVFRFSASWISIDQNRASSFGEAFCAKSLRHKTSENGQSFIFVILEIFRQKDNKIQCSGKTRTGMGFLLTCL